MANVNHLGGPSPYLSKLSQLLWITTKELDIELMAQYLAGGLNLRADTLSHLNPIYKWPVHPGLFRLFNINELSSQALYNRSFCQHYERPVLNLQQPPLGAIFQWDRGPRQAGLVPPQQLRQPPFRLIPAGVRHLKLAFHTHGIRAGCGNGMRHPATYILS